MAWCCDGGLNTHLTQYMDANSSVHASTGKEGKILRQLVRARHLGRLGSDSRCNRPTVTTLMLKHSEFSAFIMVFISTRYLRMTPQRVPDQ